MKKQRFLLAIAAILALAVGCTPNPDVEEPDNKLEGVLYNVKVDDAQSYTFDSANSVRVPFVVEDAAAEFLGKSGYEVLLRYAGTANAPQECRLESVVNGDNQGEYVARIVNLSSGFYSLSVTLDIKDDTGTVFKSNEFVLVSSLGTGLPVMVITTNDGKDITSKEEWKGARISIVGAGKYASLSECDVEVKGRGNSTWGYDKKPYALKFPSKTPVLGMPKHKRWVLLANTMDKTMMRNKIAYRVAEQTSLAWTPRTEYVEVILNGKHIGNYLVAEQIRIDSNRIDIVEMDSSDNSGEAVTGGYVYEMDFHFDNVNQWWTAHGFPSSIVFPDEEDITSAQLAWGKNYFNEAESVLFGSNFKDTTNGYAKYLDAQSFVDYWLVYELCINHELGNPGSVYMHKDRGGKLVAGPVWDFDWGTFSYAASPHAQGKLFMTGAIWYRRLFEDPAFKALAKERWQALHSKFASVGDYIDEQYEYLGESAKKNFAIWNPATTGNVNGDVYLSFDDAVARLRSIYVQRVEALDAIFATW